MAALHAGKADSGSLVGKNATGMAILVTGNPMALAVAANDEAMGRVSSEGNRGTRHISLHGIFGITEFRKSRESGKRSCDGRGGNNHADNQEQPYEHHRFRVADLRGSFIRHAAFIRQSSGVFDFRQR